MSTIKVDIVSAEGQIWSGEGNLVIAPGKYGEVGIAPRHAPMMMNLRPGEVRVQLEGQDEQFFYVTGGLLEVSLIRRCAPINSMSRLRTTRAVLPRKPSKAPPARKTWPMRRASSSRPLRATGQRRDSRASASRRAFRRVPHRRSRFSCDDFGCGRSRLKALLPIIFRLWRQT